MKMEIKVMTKETNPTLDQINLKHKILFLTLILISLNIQHYRVI